MLPDPPPPHDDEWFWSLDGPAIANTRFKLVTDGFEPPAVGTFLNEVGLLVDELLLELHRLYETYEPDEPATRRGAA